MTKDLYYTIPEYFRDRMNEHSKVVSVHDETTTDFYLYRITRKHFGNVLVWLSYAYRFTDMDYNNRPAELSSGDFILIAKPEGGFTVSEELIINARIGVGQLAKLMGALTARNPWEYLTPTEREKLNRSEMRR